MTDARFDYESRPFHRHLVPDGGRGDQGRGQLRPPPAAVLRRGGVLPGNPGV